MSYARFGSDGSDVYVYLSTTGLVCCGCSINGGITGCWFETESAVAMLEHLDAHREAGGTVPDDCYAELRRDAEASGDAVHGWYT